MPSVLRKVLQSQEVGIVLLIAVCWVVYTALGSGFLNSFNLFTLSQVTASYAIIGFAQLAVLAVGQMNLAVGAIGVVVAMFTGWLITSVGMPIIVAMVLGIVLGTLSSLLIGWLVLVTGLNSFIVTVSILSIYTGLMYVLTQATPINIPASLSAVGIDQLGSPFLSALIIPMIVISIGLWFLYNRTSLGWRMLAVGGNERAATISGVRVPRMVLIAFALSGFLCAVAAEMETIRAGAALPTLGGDWILPAFVLPILGGSSLRGGSASILGTVLATVFLMSIGTGMGAMNVPAYWNSAAQAAVLLVAVVVDEGRRRRQRQARAAAMSQPLPPQVAEEAVSA